MEISIIIFSFNRAMQLDALLKSIDQYWHNPDICVFVIYNSSSSFYEKGYLHLKNKRRKQKNLYFIKESGVKKTYKIKDFIMCFNLKHYIKYSYIRNFKTDFRKVVCKCIKSIASDFVMFLTDDSVFIKDVIVPNKVLADIKKNPFSKSLSLRLGIGLNNLPNDIKVTKDLLSWNYYRYKKLSNWGYPFSIDGHIYAKEIIHYLIDKIVFTNPSSLEMFFYAYIYKHKWISEGFSFLEGKLLSFPLNMVQNVENNQSSGLDVNIMNEKYLNGFELVYPEIHEIKMFQQYPNSLSFKKGEIIESYILKE